MYYVNNIINTIVGFIFLAIICLVIFGLPAAMTVWNIISLTPKKDKVKNRRKKDIATLLLGFCLTAVMIKLMSNYHWDEPVMIGGDLFSILHEPFIGLCAVAAVICCAAHCLHDDRRAGKAASAAGRCVLHRRYIRRYSAVCFLHITAYRWCI